MAQSLQQRAAQVIANTPKDRNPLTKDDLVLENGQANKEATVATYDVDLPVVVDVASVVRMLLTAYQSYETDGTGGNTETFNLSHSVVDSPNTDDPLVLFEGANRVQPDSVDYANDTFDYTDDGTSNVLHAYYVSDTPAAVEIVKKAPAAADKVEGRLLKENLGLINQQEQFKQGGGVSWGVDPSDPPLRPVIPSDWTMQIHVTGPYATTWDDSDDAANGSDGTTAENALLDLPVYVLPDSIDGLGTAVKRSITG